MFAPTDDEVEVVLGKVQRSWAPIPHADYQKNGNGSGYLLASLAMLLLMGSFIGSILITGMVLQRKTVFIHDPIWWLTVIALIAITMIPLFKLDRAMYNRRRLGIHQSGIRFGKSILRFDELVSVGTGSYQGFMEKYFPWWDRLSELRHSAYGEAKSRIRAGTLDLARYDGSTVHWVGVLEMFRPEDLEEFLTLLSQHVDVKIDLQKSEATASHEPT